MTDTKPSELNLDELERYAETVCRCTDWIGDNATVDSLCRAVIPLIACVRELEAERLPWEVMLQWGRSHVTAERGTSGFTLNGGTLKVEAGTSLDISGSGALNSGTVWYFGTLTVPAAPYSFFGTLLKDGAAASDNLSAVLALSGGETLTVQNGASFTFASGSALAGGTVTTAGTGSSVTFNSGVTMTSGTITNAAGNTITVQDGNDVNGINPISGFLTVRGSNPIQAGTFTVGATLYPDLASGSSVIVVEDD